MTLHPLLRRQLRKLKLEPDQPPDAEQWAELIDRVNQAYQEADQDRHTWQRSMEFSSAEMQELYRQIAAERDKLMAVMTAVGIGLCTLDPAGGLQFINPAGRKLLSITGPDPLGEPILDNLLAPERVSELILLRQVLSSGQSYRHEDSVFVRMDGTTFPANYHLNPITKDGVSIGTVLVFRDISDRKNVEAELKAARRAADSANQAKSDFLASMSHEIRTPMNGVVSMAEILLGTSLSAEQRECAEVVRGSAETLLALINDLLDFSKIEAGRIDLEAIPFDLHRTLESSVELLAERAHRKGLELAYLVDRGVPEWVKGDPTRLRQILINLLGNAVKFTDQGEVTLRVTAEEGTRGPRLRFAVTDTGIGLDPSARQRLFEPFSQADASTTRKYGGTGLGLAICRRLTTLMGGEIGVESEPGVGSTFWFTVRLDEASPQGPAAAPMPDKRVLVVDDNATHRTMLAEQLRIWGLSAEESADGPQALRELRMANEQERPFDLVLIDLLMPGQDGLALARAIKADPLLRAIPLVLMSSLGLYAPIEEARDAGIQACWTKPIHRGSVLAVLSPAEEAPPVSELEQRVSLPPLAGFSRLLLAEDNPVNQLVATRMLSKLGYEADVGQWPGGDPGLPPGPVRGHPHGLPDARDGRVRGHGRDPEARGAGIARPDHRADGQCATGRSRALSRGRDGRPRGQAHHLGGAARGAVALGDARDRAGARSGSRGRAGPRPGYPGQPAGHAAAGGSGPGGGGDRVVRGRRRTVDRPDAGDPRRGRSRGPQAGRPHAQGQLGQRGGLPAQRPLPGARTGGARG
jgi:PAS domain S-box-containing protein